MTISLRKTVQIQGRIIVCVPSPRKYLTRLINIGLEDGANGLRKGAATRKNWDVSYLTRHRAAERYADITPEERTRRRQRGWGNEIIVSATKL